MEILKNKSIKWWVGTVSCIVLFVFIGSFAYLKMDFLMKGVQIVAKVHKNDGSSIVEIKGNAKNATYLTLNGREIYIDKDGSFTEPVALLPGLSILTINAEDKFGKTSEKKIELMYQENTGAFAYNEIKINNN